MYKKHFIRFSIALTLLFVLGFIFMLAVNASDNAKTGKHENLGDRIREVMGN